MKKILGFLFCCVGIVAFGSDTGDSVSEKIGKWEKRAKRRKRKLGDVRAARDEAKGANADLQRQLEEALAQNETLKDREVQSRKRNRALEERLEAEANKAATYHMIMVGLRQKNDALLVQLRALGIEGESPLEKLVRSYQEKDECNK